MKGEQFFAAALCVALVRANEDAGHGSRSVMELSPVRVAAKAGLLARALLHNREGKTAPEAVAFHAVELAAEACCLSLQVPIGRCAEMEQRAQRFFADAWSETQRARGLFPGNTLQLAALHEEVGELSDAYLDWYCGDPDSNVRTEAVQVAAMACRVATEGDSTMPYVPPAAMAVPMIGFTAS
jgi:hypothetical protein